MFRSVRKKRSQLLSIERANRWQKLLPTTLDLTPDATPVRIRGQTKGRMRGQIKGRIHTVRRRTLAPRKERLRNLRDDGERRVDDVRDFVLRRLPHECLRAAFGKAVVGLQPSLQLSGRDLKRFE